MAVTAAPSGNSWWSENQFSCLILPCEPDPLVNPGLKHSFASEVYLSPFVKAMSPPEAAALRPILEKKATRGATVSCFRIEGSGWPSVDKFCFDGAEGQAEKF